MLGNSGFKGINSGKKYLISILLVIVFTLFTAFLLVKPNYLKYRNLADEHKTKNLQLLNMQKKQNELKTTDRGEVTNITEKLLMAVPIENNYLKVYGGMKYLADKNGIVITDFKIRPGIINITASDKKETDNGEKIGMDLSIQGSLLSIREMVYEVENSLPINEITKLTFNNSRIASGSATTQMMEAEISLVSYWQELPKYLEKYEAPVNRLDDKDYDVYEKIKDYPSMFFSIVPLESPTDSVPVGRDNPFPV